MLEIYYFIFACPKIINKNFKKDVLNNGGGGVAWWSDHKTDITCPDSLIYKYINDIDGTNNYLKNTTYVPTGWESKIATYEWKYGDITSIGDYDGPTIFAIEDDWTDTIPAKIGLMYIHDYFYAYASGGAPGSASNAAAAWIYIQEEGTM